MIPEISEYVVPSLPTCAADTLGCSSDLNLDLKDLMAKQSAASTCPTGLTGTVQRPAFLAQECRRLPQLPDQQERAAQASDRRNLGI